MKFLWITFIMFFSFGCTNSNEANKEAERIAQQTQNPVHEESQDGYERAYFASGCFWCVEGIYESVIGVKEVNSGYSGGKMKNPTYQNHGDHAETVEVIYNPVIVSFSTLLDVYFGSQDVTQVNGQGPDRGTSYRSIVFYRNEKEKKLIDSKIASLNLKLGGNKVAAQVLPFQKFYVAEDYHQDYERKNPNNPYIINVSHKRKQKFVEKFPELTKKDNLE